MRGRRRPAGYLLVLVAVCVSMLSISFLRLAASSGQADDDAEAEVASTVAYYAAESGLVEAELRLANAKAAPPPGPWLVGTLVGSNGRYSVEVVPASAGATGFLLRSTGKTEGEGARVISTTVEARVEKGPKSSWLFRDRRRI